MSKKRTIIQTMIVLLVTGATIVGSTVAIMNNGHVNWSNLKLNNNNRTEDTTPDLPENTTIDDYEETTGKDYDYNLPKPDSADDDEKYLNDNNFSNVGTDDNVGGANKEEVTITPETSAPAETKPQTPETTAPVETKPQTPETTAPAETTSPSAIKDYADMISSVQTALNEKYKAESIDDNYKAQVYDIFAVTVNGNNIKTYALAKLPATNSNVLLEITHSHANASLLKETKIDIFKTCDPEKWENDGYRVYCSTLDNNKISNYTLYYLAIDNENEKTVYETLKPQSSGKEYKYQYFTITRSGVNVNEKANELTVASKLNHAKMVAEIEALQATADSGLTQ